MQKHQLTQKQSLRQIISQQTIQLMKLIELSNNGLEEEIMKELEENPALEVDHEEDQYEMDESNHWLTNMITRKMQIMNKVMKLSLLLNPMN